MVILSNVFRPSETRSRSIFRWMHLVTSTHPHNYTNTTTHHQDICSAHPHKRMKCCIASNQNQFCHHDHQPRGPRHQLCPLSRFRLSQTNLGRERFGTRSQHLYMDVMVLPVQKLTRGDMGCGHGGKCFLKLFIFYVFFYDSLK